MTSRFIALFSCGLALAVACGSDDDNKQPTPDDVAGAGGEAGSPPSSSAGSSATAGSGGTSASAGGGAGGEPSVAGAGAGGESSVAGAPSEGGTPNEPEGPISACGVGKYETGDGCTTCPAPPTPNDPTPLGCAYFDSAEKNELTLLVTFADAPLHDPVAGESPVSWVSSDQSTGEASVPWQYSPATGTFTFDLPLDARYAVEFTFNGWAFTDACGFHFTAGALRVAEGTEGWLCALPL